MNPQATPPLAGASGSVQVLAMYRTAGPRLRDHRIVIYLDADRAWTARHFQRNGSQSPALARAPMPAEAAAYCACRPRAASLRYNGQHPQDAAGLADDLRALGFDSDSVERLVLAAAPYLSPNEKADR